MAGACSAPVTSAPEASGCLVAPPVFKTGGRRDASPAGSIPVRLRYRRAWSVSIVRMDRSASSSSAGVAATM